MTQKILCIYHANCADGLGAAWAVHKARGDNVEFVAAKYGEQHLFPNSAGPHDSNGPLGFCQNCLRNLGLDGGRDLLIVDFSYPLPILRAMAQEARSVVVLDHHKTAEEELKPILAINQGDYKKWIEQTPGLGPNLAAIFDQSRSGAGITWDYLHPEVRRPRIIDLIEDRDLWKFKFGDESRAFHAVLASYGWTDLPGMFERLDQWQITSKFDGDWEDLLSRGHAILRAQQQVVASAVAASRRTMWIGIYVVPVANVPPTMASEAGHLLCQPTKEKISGFAPDFESETLTPLFSATYYDGADGKRHFSLRSPEGGADVGNLARKMAEKLAGLYPLVFVGGGHEHAAGFDAPIGWEGE